MFSGLRTSVFVPASERLPTMLRRSFVFVAPVGSSDRSKLFIAPPSMAELSQRLRGRGTETDEAIARRLRIAETEVAAAGEFEYVVINEDAGRAADEVVAIIEERRKVT